MTYAYDILYLVLEYAYFESGVRVCLCRMTYVYIVRVVCIVLLLEEEQKAKEENDCNPWHPISIVPHEFLST